MNKQDIAIVTVLAAILIGWLFYQNKINSAQRAKMLETRRANATNVTTVASISCDAQTSATWNAQADSVNTQEITSATNAPANTNTLVPTAVLEQTSNVPEKKITISDNEVELTVSSKGGTIVDTTLFGYRQTIDKNSGPVKLDFEAHKALALEGIPGFGINADYDIVSQTATGAVLRCTSNTGLTINRVITLLPDYKISVADTFINTSTSPLAIGTNMVGMGSVRRFEDSKANLLSADNLSAVRDSHGSLGKVQHWEKKNRLLSAISGGSGGGCAGAPNSEVCPKTASVILAEPQEWVAIKSRFFAQVFSASVPNTGFRLDIERSLGKGPLQLSSVAGAVSFDAMTLTAGDKYERSYTLYIGPKKLSVLRRFGAKTAEIMDFGTFKWVCVLLVPTLNFLFMIFRNYGVAIIILTLIVRIIFWPLTHKSTESMKRMQEVQPLLKDIQAKFKNDPQKLQQETMALYREHKVNPMASCLPMFIQIPVFIALFTVLRSAVELRFAPFLWVADLSEPENLLKGVLPFIPALNILPFIMAGTMFLQSKLTPSMGDPAQQKMMMWMMPLMMLFMFYTMPSALVLYWSVSQILAIAQLWWQKRQSAGKNASGDAGSEEVMTRQARRRLAR